MNLNIIFTILSRLVDDYEDAEIGETIKSVASNMARIASNPSNSTAAQKEYNENHTSLFMKLRELDSNNLSSFEVEYLKKRPFDFLLPGNLSSKVLAAERGKNLTPADSKVKFDRLFEAFEQNFDNAKTLIESLESIGADTYINPGEVFLALVMSSEDFDSNLKSFHVDLKEFDQGITFLSEGAGLSDGKPKIHALSNITPITIVTASIGLVIAVSKIIEKALDIAIKKREFEKLGVEIAISNVELADNLSKHINDMRQSEVELLVEELSSNKSNDKKTKVRKGVEKLFSLIEKGHTIDFVVSEPDAIEEGEEEEGGENILSFEQFQDLRKISYELKKLKKEDVTRLLLPAPEYNDGGEEE